MRARRSVRDILQEFSLKLMSCEIEESRLESELILMKCLTLSRAQLYTILDYELTDLDISLSYKDLQRRLDREPWSYISGHKEFYGLDILVEPGVFIPRPETELIVDTSLSIFNAMDSNRQVKIVDACTGSGAIAIAISKHISNAQIYATEISDVALKIANRNLHAHGLEDRIEILKGSLLEPIESGIDILVSNPPYIPSQDIENLQPEVLHEPTQALDGGSSGLDIITELMIQASSKMSRPGSMLIEFHPTQSLSLQTMASQLLSPCKSKVINDLYGDNRLLVVDLF